MSERILVVDDHAITRKTLEAHLRAAGYEVTPVESGRDALSRFAEAPPDLVLLDILMPALDGLATCRRLRALPRGREVPVVFLTALGDQMTHEHAIASGGDDFLSKPINRTELLMRVRSLLRIKRLNDKNRDLVEMIVHDLKNPLSSIMVALQLVGAEPQLSEDGRACVNDASEASQQMLGMVLDLLDVTRADEEQLTADRQPFDLPALLDEVRLHMRLRAQSAKVRIESSHALAHPALRADRELLRRVLENLVDNALRFSPAGSAIALEAHGDERELHLWVRDHGRGIPAEARPKLFAKYVRLEGDHTRVGRGLGLVFCRLAVEAHGGRISVEDNPPQGAAFHITLPIA